LSSIVGNIVGAVVLKAGVGAGEGGTVVGAEVVGALVAGEPVVGVEVVGDVVGYTVVGAEVASVGASVDTSVVVVVVASHGVVSTTGQIFHPAPETE
jgi:hypothetical protein